MKHGTSLSVILLAINLMLPGMVKAAESLPKIRVGLPSLALTYMPFYTAQEKGLLKKVGLEAEYIQMNTGIQPLVSMFNKDGRLPPKVARGYLDLLRQERSVPADLDPQKFVDFSTLPGGK
jgi:hypothetical protein